ncbi:sorting nexin [Anaeramoeba flamelloides]|uniref:Sorting nexin n=1 Tax=Anaeramoeba flamelloides TaxID=1746091 RepID=A0AAV8A6N8_9EUKA|nr:sorting nexin [Anaeramoeba flamelloides]
MYRACAEYSFEGSGENELGFETDDELVVTELYEDDESGWVAGYKLNDPEKTIGLFPSSYIQLGSQIEFSLEGEENSQQQNEQQYQSQLQNQNQNQTQTQNQLDEKLERNVKNVTTNNNTDVLNNLVGSFDILDEDIILESKNSKIVLGTEEKSQPKIKKTEILEGYKWEPNEHNIISKVLGVEEHGVLKKNHKFKLQIQYMNLTNIIKLSWEDFKWMQLAYTKQYPNFCIPPMLEIKSSERPGYDNIGDCRKHSLQLYLNRISEHPILGKSEILYESLSSIDSKAFQKKKKHIAKNNTIFWKTVHHNFSSPSKKIIKQIDLFKKNLKRQSNAMMNLYLTHKDFVTNNTSAYCTGLEEVGKMFFEWSKINFDWRKNKTQSDQQINISMKNIIKLISNAWGTVSLELKKHYETERDVLELFLKEYVQYLNSYQQPFEERSKTHIQLLEQKQSLLSHEKKTFNSLKNDSKHEELQQKTESLQNKDDTLTFINLVESEYFRKMRIRDTSSTLKSYVDLQVNIFNSFTQEFKTIQRMLSEIQLEEN